MNMNAMDEVKNQVREASDIAQVIGECVELKKAGTRFMGLCPFHVEKTPSFTVNSQGQFFHCFGCGESGDIFSFVMKYHRLSFPEALKELARRYHVDVPEPRLSDADKEKIKKREQLYQVNESAAVLYSDCLHESPGSQDARDYLEKRGVPLEFIKRYRLGYAPDPKAAGWTFLTDRLRRKKLSISSIEQAGLAVKKDQGSGYYDRFRDRVLFPIVNMTGQVVAFGGRILGEGKPKYMNSPESPVFDKSRLLFGLQQHKDAIRSQRQAIVVEGNFDMLLLAVHGIENVVAPLGTALSQKHIRLLRGFCDEVVLLFDGDSAGLKAAVRSVPFFLDEQVDARVALLPTGLDPDSYVREKGASAIKELVSGARSLAEFVYEHYVKQYGSTLEGKNKIIGEMKQLVQSGGDSVQRTLMTNHFCEKLGIEPAQFMEVAQGRQKISSKPVPVKPTSKNQSFGDLPKMQRQVVDFIILYPEFLEELLNNGLEKAIQEPVVGQIIHSLKGMTADERLAPGNLLAALSGDEQRAYVAELLSAIPEIEDDEPEKQARLMCEELISWLATQRQLRTGVDLQQQIHKAQMAGDIERVLDLLRQKQESDAMN